MSDLAYIQLFIIFSIALVTTLTEVLKNALKINKDYAPLLSIILGIAYSVGFTISAGLFIDYTFTAIISGVAIGLSGSGLYDNIKKGLKFFE